MRTGNKAFSLTQEHRDGINKNNLTEAPLLARELSDVPSFTGFQCEQKCPTLDPSDSEESRAMFRIAICDLQKQIKRRGERIACAGVGPVSNYN